MIAEWKAIRRCWILILIQKLKSFVNLKAEKTLLTRQAEKHAVPLETVNTLIIHCV